MVERVNINCNENDYLRDVHYSWRFILSKGVDKLALLNFTRFSPVLDLFDSSDINSRYGAISLPCWILFYATSLTD